MFRTLSPRARCDRKTLTTTSTRTATRQVTQLTHVERRNATNATKVAKVEAKAMEETAEAEEEAMATNPMANSNTSSKENAATATNMVTSRDVARQDYTMKNRRRRRHRRTRKSIRESLNSEALSRLTLPLSPMFLFLSLLASLLTSINILPSSIFLLTSRFLTRRKWCYLNKTHRFFKLECRKDLLPKALKNSWIIWGKWRRKMRMTVTKLATTCTKILWMNMATSLYHHHLQDPRIARIYLSRMLSTTLVL
jgi:hypothetical protein